MKLAKQAIEMMCGVGVILAAVAAPAGAQVSKTLNGTLETVTVSVEGIERASREITVKKKDGSYDVLYVPEQVKQFDTLKIGDKITAKYDETLVIRLQEPGQKPIDAEASALTKSTDSRAATASHQRTITATITHIDPKVPSITVSGPNNWTYTKRVEDTKMLAKVKVGDKLDLTWTEAVIMSLEAGK